jgi:curved DNA-binding protein CbpA
VSALSNPHRTLGVSHDAGQEEIRAAYLKLLRAHPPEKEPEKFKEIRTAYERLKDERERIRTAVLQMDLTDPGPVIPFPEIEGSPPCFSPDDILAVLASAGEFGRRDFPEDLTSLDEEGILHEV